MALTKLQKEFINKNSQRFFLKEIADMLGCNIRAIQNYCYYNGFSYKSKRLTKEDIEYIINHHRKFTIEELANDLQTKKANIERIFREYKLPIKHKEINKNDLTNMEQKVLEIICKQGVFKNNEIAKILYLAECTICTHMNNLYSKTDSHSKAELIYKYYNGQIKIIEVSK